MSRAVALDDFAAMRLPHIFGLHWQDLPERVLTGATKRLQQTLLQSNRLLPKYRTL